MSIVLRFLQISAGRGTVIGSEVFLTYTDAASDRYVADITAVSLATGYNAVGLWRIPVGQGKKLYILKESVNNSWQVFFWSKSKKFTEVAIMHSVPVVFCL